MSCKDCKHVLKDTPSGAVIDLRNAAAYYCRRYPPQVIAVFTPQGVATTTAAPTVDPSGLCGEFSPGKPTVTGIL